MMKNPAASSPASSAPFAAAGPPQAWWQAAKRGDVARLESLHAAGAEVNAIHRDSGQTALHMACQHGRNEAALWLLAHGAALNGATKWGETPLYKAVASGHEALVTTLLAQGADPNIGAGHHAPLAAAVFRNDVTLVKALLARGAAPHFPGIRNPLLSALLSTHREVLALLLAHGADPTRHEDLASAPLVQAVRQGDLAVLEMLLPHLPADHLRCAAGTQAVFESVMGDKPDMLAWLLRQGCPPDFGENTPEGVLPPLVMAAHLGNPVLVILLLRAQADVAADLSWNWMGNALVAACSGPAPHGEVIQALLANNVPLDGVDHNGLTAVHHALKGRHADILAQLLLAGATLPAGCRNAAFLLVAETGEVALAQRLLAEGAELECREQDANLPGDDGQPLPDAVSSRPNKTLGNFMKIFSEIDLDLESAEQRAEEKAKEHPWNGATPLFKAAAAGQAAMTRWLSEQGAEPNIRLDHGTLLLNEAVASNSLPTVEALLEHGADPNAQDSTGWSPLHQAAQGEAGDDHSPPTAQSNAAALNMAQCLHAHGAKLDVSDDEGWTPLLSALTEGRAPVAEWLLAQGADPLVTTADGYTALMAAAVGNLPQLFAPLLAAHGAASPLEITDDEGWTALGYAAHWGHAEAVSALLERGANPDHQTAEGKSADDLATAKGHHAVARLLRPDAGPGDETPDPAASAVAGDQAETCDMRQFLAPAQTLLDVLQGCWPDFDPTPLQEALAAWSQPDAEKPKYRALRWLADGLIEQNFMVYFEWKEYFGEWLELAPLTEIAEEAGYDPTPLLQALADEEACPAFPSEAPFLELQNHALKRHKLEIVSLPFENAYCMALPNRPGILKAVAQALAALGLPFLRHPPLSPPRALKALRQAADEV